jgi:hypothetical protein
LRSRSRRSVRLPDSGGWRLTLAPAGGSLIHPASSSCPGDGLLRSRSWLLLDPGLEQVYDLSSARRAQLWPPGGSVDLAGVGLAVELRQRSKNAAAAGLASSAAAMSSTRSLRCGPSGPVRRPRRPDCDIGVAHPRRGQGERSAAAARLDLPADPVVNRAGDGMLGFGAPRLVRVKRHRDNRAASRTSSNVGAGPLDAHEPQHGTVTGKPDTQAWQACRRGKHARPPSFSSRLSRARMRR